MSKRSVARWCALSGLVAALAVGVPASSQGAKSADDLPACKPRSASKSAPSGTPKVTADRACRAKPTRAPESATARHARESTTVDGDDMAGYTHLGAGTGNEWGGVSGRIEVTNGSVRRGTYDFVASRFMVKQDQGNGQIAWLEAGWAETGWSGAGRQRIYTYDTNTRAWRFHDGYDVRPGDRLWFDLRAAGDTWQAWLWWDNRWNLLASERLPLGRTAHVEQYVELYVDPRRPSRVAVPPVTVDNVRLLPAGSSGGRLWREDIHTVTAHHVRERESALCLKWVTRFDTWSAGSCR